MAAEMYAVESIESRNRNMQIAAEERARNPQVIVQQKLEDQARASEVLRGHIETFLQMFRSRCRAAAGRWASARGAAESIIADVEQTMWSRFGNLKGDVALLAAAEYLKELENGIAETLEKIGAIARDEQRQENFAAAQRRRMGWVAEAAKLDATGVIKALEIHGAKLVLQDGRIGIKAAGVDERTRIYVSAHAAEIRRILVEREQVLLIETEDDAS
jgi:hypothetical protein